MTILDSVDVWLGSLRQSFDAAGVEVRALRSQSDRPNPSYAVNLRRGDREADLVLWESGEGELVLAVGLRGDPLMEHHDDLKTNARLGAVLAAMLQAIGFSLVGESAAR